MEWHGRINSQKINHAYTTQSSISIVYGKVMDKAVRAIDMELFTSDGPKLLLAYKVFVKIKKETSKVYWIFCGNIWHKIVMDNKARNICLSLIYLLIYLFFIKLQIFYLLYCKYLYCLFARLVLTCYLKLNILYHERKKTQRFVTKICR